jgi:hypothetical protein
MFRDRLGPADVQSVLQAFPYRPAPDFDGWQVQDSSCPWPVDIEIAPDSEFKELPQSMVKGCAQLLGIWRPPRRPATQVVLVFRYNPDDQQHPEWEMAQAISRAFAQRWKVVFDDHANTRWLVRPN